MSNPLTAPAETFHAAKRGGEVVAALLKFGFGELVTKSGLHKFLPRGLSPKAVGPDAQPAPVRVRLLLEQLGPTFIKAGQVLATRPDLIPPKFAAELKQLQSNVPPAPWAPDSNQKPDPERYVEAALQRELGTLVTEGFRSIDPEPLAAASMAQVHRAVLTDGTAVVLKILRPGIQKVIAADLHLMHWVAELAAAHLSNLGFDAPAVVKEFERQLAKETDLLIEARSIERMSRDLAGHDGVNFPAVYPAVSTRRVLALEHIEGILLADIGPDDLTPELRTTLVANAADAVFRQCLALGFFHADPHGGNIFVDPDTGALTFIDCGMTGQVDPNSAEQLAQITHGAIEGDLNRVVRTAVRLADAPPGISDNRAFRSDLWRFIDHFRGSDLSSIRMGALLDEFFVVLRTHHLRCPADIVYLIKALTTIEGVAQSIAPNFDLVGHVRPYVTRLVKRRIGLRSLKHRMLRGAVNYADLADELPVQVDDILRMVRQNRTTLNLKLEHLDTLTGGVSEASKHIAWAVILGAVMLGASILVLADRIDRSASYLSVIATLGFVAASATGLFRLLRPRRH